MKTSVAALGFVVSAVIGGAIGFSAGKSQTTSATVQVQAPRADNNRPSPSPSPSNNNAPAGADDVYKVPVGDTTAVKGPDDALVTIVEFSDFQCPFCSRVGPTLKQIESTYGNKVRVGFRHNPLPFHQNAPLAAEYALAAKEQGKFWEMHDKMFGNQQALAEADLDRYAQEVGLDLGKVKAFLASGKAKQIIAQDQALAAKVGARGTPAFFINGVNLSGAQPFENFQRVIDAQLEKANAMVSKGVSKKELYAKIIENGRESAPPPPQQPQQPPQTRQNVALVDGTPTKGGKEPLVTIVEWSDFQCPFCSRVGPTLKEIQDSYGDKVAIQFRNQPLSFHPRAMPAAKAALAAHKQGKFWQMHDKMFGNQQALNDEDLERYAKELGLNVQKWKSDMESTEVQSIINKDMSDGGTYGARGTPTLFVNGVPVRGAQPFAAFKTVIDAEVERAEKLIKDGVKRKDVYAEILKREAGKNAGGDAPAQPSAPAAPAGPVNVDTSRAPVQGPKEAPVKIVLYSDFQCPFCSRVGPSIEKIKETYGNNVSIAFKHFPLSFHQNAEPAAIASLAAHKQGKFWQMHDKMFANQQSLTRDQFIAWAKELGMDAAKFEKDLDDPALKAWVKKDTEEGTANGVNGTPATFVNGRLVSGAQPFEAFKTIIDEELKKKGKS